MNNETSPTSTVQILMSSTKELFDNKRPSEKQPVNDSLQNPTKLCQNCNVYKPLSQMSQDKLQLRFCKECLRLYSQSQKQKQTQTNTLQSQVQSNKMSKYTIKLQLLQQQLLDHLNLPKSLNRLLTDPSGTKYNKKLQNIITSTLQ